MKNQQLDKIEGKIDQINTRIFNIEGYLYSNLKGYTIQEVKKLLVEASKVIIRLIWEARKNEKSDKH